MSMRILLRKVRSVKILVKIAKGYLITVVVFFIALALYGMYIYRYEGKRPSEQPGTEWISEDGSIKFYVDENLYATGSMNIKDTEIPFIFSGEIRGERIHIYAIEAKGREGLYPEERYETWRGNFKRKDKFTVTVEETTYFKIGQKIRFYRVDDDKSKQ